MLFQQLLGPGSAGRPLRVGLIGCGHFGRGILAQAPLVPGFALVAIADTDVEGTLRACRDAGFADGRWSIADSAGKARTCIAGGGGIITPDAMMLAELPLDVIVEATGLPEASARHALTAIEHGKHVAMVSKETDACVGPILKHLADRAGVVYTAVDGDQHGLAIGLVDWCRALGLEVICTGKAVDDEWIYDEAARTVSDGERTATLTESEAWMLDPIPPKQAARYVEARRHLSKAIRPIGNWDLTELTILANATGLAIDRAQAHQPVLRVTEMADTLRPSGEGGILDQSGVVDAVRVMRRRDEAGLGGGAFAVFRADNKVLQRRLQYDGVQPNPDGTTNIVLRPHHFLGLEAVLSIRLAGTARIPSGASTYRPRYDMISTSTRDLKAGEVIGNDHDPALQGSIVPAVRLEPGSPIPAHLALGRALTVDVPAGTALRPSMFAWPEQSTLWRLRQQQDTQWLHEPAEEPVSA